VSLIDYRFWLSVIHLFYGTCLILLILVLLPGIGSARYGAQRWLDLGGFSLQPSEPAKAAVLLVTASILKREKVGRVFQFLGVLGQLALAVGIPIFLLLLLPHLTSVIVLPPMGFSMLYVSRLSTRFFVAALGAFSLLIGVIAWDSARYINYMEENNYSYVND